MIIILALLLGLSAHATSDIKCEANYDHMGIAHQKVDSLKNFYYCFGYLHGKDRAWEMDYFRRVGLGRNAEIYGFSQLKGDLMMRLLDLPKLAQRLYEGMPAENKAWLEAYANGATDGFVEGKKAQEFVDLGYEPEPWRPVDSILVLILQSFDQTRKTFFRDYEEEKLKESWKDKTEAMFNEDNQPWFNTILKEGEYQKADAPAKTTYTQPASSKLWADFPQVFGKESGSNNWVVSKNKSKSGYAMLANDPHLDLKTPMFWYWINLSSPEASVIGASVPGVPVVVSGTNGKVAWGLTNAYINTADAVFIKDLPEDYIESFRPTVKVKFGFMKLPFFFKSFERTKDGNPVIPLELDTDERMILKWSGFSLKSEDLLPMFDLIKAQTVDSMDESLQHVGLPAWNFVFADTKGQIGYRQIGQAYKQPYKDAYGIETVTMEEFKSQNFLDPMERPHVLKPKRDYVYTANNRHWPKDSKYYGGRGYSYSFRGFRIDELLKDGKHDFDSFRQIQCDRQAVDARFFVPKILKSLDIAELKDWNYMTDENSMAPAVYRRLMDLMMEHWKLNEYALFNYLDKLDQSKKDEMKNFYLQAKKDIKERNWGQLHRLTFAHLSKNEDWKFSPELPGVGDNHSVDPGTSKWDLDKNYYEQYSGASMRMMIEMRDTPIIKLALPGVNRNYQHTEYNQAWQDWRNCQYQVVEFQKQ